MLFIENELNILNEIYEISNSQLVSNRESTICYLKIDYFFKIKLKRIIYSKYVN